LGDKVRFVVHGIGETLVTGGLIILLFVVYEVYITNFFAHREQTHIHTALENQWLQGTDPLLRLPNGSLPKLATGVGIANLYIPRLGRDYAWTIVQGTSDADLEKGPGHYGGTALPGKIGNFAVAGHRVGKGEPFLNLDHLRVADAVIVETESHWYVYRVKGSGGDLSAKGADGIPGREVVVPSDSNVLRPVPDHPGQKPTEALMTMTTCHPKFTAAKRMIVYAQLDQTVLRQGTTMPTPIAQLYGQVVG
jgi:sortase A